MRVATVLGNPVSVKFVVAAMALLWWFDRSRYGAVLRAVGEDELAAQSVGVNLTAVLTGLGLGGIAQRLQAATRLDDRREWTAGNVVLGLASIGLLFGLVYGVASALAS